jgi:glycosyltransferase involved in cell wall biosynthesis
VQRFALEVLSSLDQAWKAIADSRGTPAPIVLTPRGAVPPRLECLRVEAVGSLQGHAWEQIQLLQASRDGFLINFGATGPLLKRRQLITVHDAAVHVVPEAYSRAFRAWYKMSIPVLARTSAGVMTVSDFSKRELCKYFSMPEQKIRVCPEGKEHIERTVADSQILAQHGLRPGQFFLAVSSLSPHKNFRLITQALRHLVDSGITVAIAGSTDPSVFHHTSKGETELVKLLGYVSDESLKSLLQNAIALIHPSRYEGFGLAPLEAMAVGCPVLASNAAAIPEVCADAVWYFDPNDPRELAAAMTRLAGDVAAREDLRRAGLERAESFRWADASATYLKVLSELGAL